MNDEALDYLDSLPFFDKEDILRRFQEGYTLFLPLLLHFERNLRPTVDRLEKHFKEGQFELVIQDIHSMRGALGNMAAITLLPFLENLERANSKQEMEFLEIYSSFLQEFNVVCLSIKEISVPQNTTNQKFHKISDEELIQNIFHKTQEMLFVENDLVKELESRFLSQYLKEIKRIKKGLLTFEYGEAQKGLSSLQKALLASKK